MTKDKLSTKENVENVVAAGISAIPVVGGSLSTLYFGRKQEKRFKRIEKFYDQLSKDFEQIQQKVLSIEGLNQEAVSGIIEEVNEGVEKDYLESKLEYFKNCFLNTLIEQTSESYGKRKFFIQTLGDMTDIDIEVIQALYGLGNGSGYKPDPDSKNEKNSEFMGTLEKLKSLGFVNATLNGTFVPGVNFAGITLYTISDFGKEFVEYCLQLSVVPKTIQLKEE